MPRAVILLSTLLLAGCNLQQDVSQRSDVSGSGQHAAPINGQLTNGQTMSVLDKPGAVTVIDFWGSWCGPCRAEQNDLNVLYSRFASKGALFVGVDMRDDDAAANAYRQDFSVAYPSFADASGSISAAYNVAAPPTLVIVDKQGKIVSRLLGTLNDSSATLAQLLK